MRFIMFLTILFLHTSVQFFVSLPPLFQQLAFASILLFLMFPTFSLFYFT